MIYVIGERNQDGSMSEFVKVGFVYGGEDSFLKRVKNRVNKLQVGNPRRLVVIGKATGEREQEKMVHRLFTHARVKRPIVTEWMHVEAGGEFAAWVDSVRIDEMTFGVKLKPKEEKAAKAVRIKKEKVVPWCSWCDAPDHARYRCPLFLRDQAEQRKGGGLVVRPGRKLRSKDEWSWRGKVRPMLGSLPDWSKTRGIVG